MLDYSQQLKEEVDIGSRTGKDESHTQDEPEPAEVVCVSEHQALLKGERARGHERERDVKRTN